LLGERADGVYIRTRGSSSEAVEFFYSRERGFFAFQWIPEPTEKPILFISNARCAPGAAASCREK
jgi:hypothetical protein